jgi:hypothetical protein
MIHYYLYLFMASSLTTCNLNCICDNSDCIYKHYISYKDRKIVKKFFNDMTINKDEPNTSTRKKNCTFGQLCDKETCGFRHRLSFSDREKLIVSYKFNKICPDKVETINFTKKPIIINNDLSSQNLYLTLDDEIEIVKEAEHTSSYSEKSWVDVVSTIKFNNKTPSRWEDMADEDFYMTF